MIAPAGGEAGSVGVHVHGVDDARLFLLAEVAHAERLVQNHGRRQGEGRRAVVVGSVRSKTQTAEYLKIETERAFEAPAQTWLSGGCPAPAREPEGRPSRPTMFRLALCVC